MTAQPPTTSAETRHPLSQPMYDSPAAEVARDMVRRGMSVLPIVVGIVWLVSDRFAAASVAYAMIIVMGNLLLSAYLLRWAARIALGLVASVALGGYAMRLALVFLAVWMVRDSTWIRMIPLGITIIATHLGLLVWELRYISATYAHPGLKPTPTRSGGVRHRPAAGYRPSRFATGTSTSKKN